MSAQYIDWLQLCIFISRIPDSKGISSTHLELCELGLEPLDGDQCVCKVALGLIQLVTHTNITCMACLELLLLDVLET
jgi:hypothetical protein